MTLIRKLSRAATQLALLVAAGCFRAETGPVGNESVESVVIDKRFVQVAVGQTVALQASVRDVNGFRISGRSPSWRSLDTAIAVVSDEGEVQGIKAGQVLVTATVDGHEGAVEVTVPAQVAADSVIGSNGGSIEIATGTSITIAPGVLPAGVTVQLSERGGATTPLDDTTRQVSIQVTSASSSTAGIPLTARLRVTAPLPAKTRAMARILSESDSAAQYTWQEESAAAGGAGGIGAYATITFKFLVHPNTLNKLVWAALKAADPLECNNINQFKPFDTVTSMTEKQAIVLMHGLQVLHWCMDGIEPKIGLKPFNLFDPLTTWSSAAAQLRKAFPTVPIYVVRYPTPLKPSFAADYIASELSKLDAKAPGSRYVIVAHSMGGLLARYVANVDKKAGRSRIAGIITLGTPHLGTAVADLFAPSEGVDWLRPNRVEDDLPLPAPVPLFAIAGGLACNRQPNTAGLTRPHLIVCGAAKGTSAVLGDGIVPTCSAVPSSSNNTACRAVSAGLTELKLSPSPTNVDHGDLPKDAAVLNLVATTIATLLPPAVATVAVSPASSSLTVGAAASLTATAKSAGGTVLSGKAASWNSSDPSVATVGVTNGVVSAIAPGTSTITATIEGVTGSGTVTVISAQAYEPNDTPATATPIAPGETQTHSMPVGDVDWLSLSITQTSSVRLVLKGASTKSHVHDFNLYDATGTKLLATMSGIPSNGITLQFSAAPAGAKVKICADASDNVCNGGPGDLDIGSYDVTFTVLSASSSPDPRPATTLDPPSATARTRRPPSWW